MIIVIADDITGAAEMGGIALRFDLSVVVSDDINEYPKADVLAVYTNTRSMLEKDAVAIMGNLTKKAKDLNLSLFYKKTDSVLRGHVYAELQAQMKALGLYKALLVPVNPVLGRVIRDGHYYVHGLPINKTSFAADPEFPIGSSSVKDMLGDTDGAVNLVSKTTEMLAKGISIGEASTNEDIASLTAIDDGSVLLAGGGSFFNALLAKRFPVKKENKSGVKLSLPLIFVSGTKFQKNVERIQQQPGLVSYMPEHIFAAGATEKINYDEWVKDVMTILSKHQKVIIAIDNRKNKIGEPDLLRERIAELVKLVFEQTTIKELLIEGGSVAYSILKKLEWKSFVPTHELQQGIVRMQVGARDVHLTIKPGSYEWPTEWTFN